MPDPSPSDEALQVCLRALRVRDHSTASLHARLERRGVAAEERDAAVARLQELGYVDDERFAHGRARALADRGAGDLLVTSDLERHGIAAETIATALASLEPEGERAAVIVARRGATPKTARLLASRGFAEETIERIVAAVAEDAVG